MVLSDRLRCSSLKLCVVPTRDERDMVTCIFTRAKFYEEPGRKRTPVSLGPSPPGPARPADLSPPALHLLHQHPHPPAALPSPEPPVDHGLCPPLPLTLPISKFWRMRR